MESVSISQVFNVAPEKLYQAWLDSDTHSKMTGGSAECSLEVGAEYSAWDGYIWGKNLELIENQKIVQSWRSAEFSDEDKDSILTVEIKALSDGKCELHLSHTNIPAGQTQYENGWVDNYIEPMMDYFHQ